MRGAPDCPAARLGRTVAGKYRIVGLLGVGGMGAVYVAEHLSLGVRVALKMILGRHTSPDGIRRFEREARRAASLRHPAICHVSDLGRDHDGSPYLEMELLAGESMQDLIARGPVPWPRAVELMTAALEGLAAAHAAGIVHRDLKPENIFLARSASGTEEVKILDFGIAKALVDDDEASLTRTGSLMGTPVFMSPEQVTDSKRVDPRSDVYAAGAVLFNLLTGARNIGGTTMPEVLGRLVSGEVERHPQKLNPEVPAWLDALVARCLATAPGDRFEHAAAMRTALTLGPAAVTGPALRSDVGLAATVPASGEHQPAVAVGAVGSSVQVAPAASRTGTAWLVGATLGIAALAAGGWILLAGRAPGADAPAIDAGIDARLPADAAPAPPPKRDGMVLIPAATFTMGSSPEAIAAAFAWCQTLAGDACQRALYEREQPARTVEVSSFFLDETEVTNAAFVRWVNGLDDVSVTDQRLVTQGGELLLDLAPPRSGLRVDTGGAVVPRDGHASLPVVQVTWLGALRYCRSRGERLPTEAEWERAARGTEGRVFSWGADRAPDCERVTYGRGRDRGCDAGGDGPRAVRTSSSDRTPEGVYDLGGNVAEWVMDEFKERYEPATGPDPIASAPEGAQVIRVVRGGYYDGHAEALRGAGRGRNRAGEPRGNLGFRCAAEVN